MLLSVGLTLGFASAAPAQLATQTALVGTVTDADGLVVPGAQVVAVNVGTKDTYETVTNDQGYYNIQFVRIGTYEISVTLTGFQTFRATGIVVGGNQIVRTDAALRVGGLTDEVTIQAGATVLATDSAAVSETINRRAVADLPLAGRNVWNLASTTPGVLGGDQNFIGTGARAMHNSLSLDGISAAANLQTQSTVRPIADAVAEVQVQTGSTSAEYGSYIGVHINVVTKSGTNTPHGAMYEFHQGDALASRGYFEDRNTPKNPRRRNQFGFQADGPVVLPGLYDGHNKTFFMGAFEGIRLKATGTAVASVPTARMRQGDFGEFTGTIRNPFTGQAYANNRIPLAELSPIALRTLQYFPEANRPGTGSNYLGNNLNQEDTNQLLARVDQNVGNTVRLSVRHNWQDQTRNGFGVVPASDIAGGPDKSRNTLVSYTHTVSQRLLNDFRIGHHRVDRDNLNYFALNGITSAGAELGIPGFDGDVQFENPGIPSFTVSGFTGLGVGEANWYQFDTTFQVANVLAYTRGSHNLRAGFEARRVTTSRRSANNLRGQFTFTGEMTGYPMADFLLGLPRRVTTPVDLLQAHVGGWRTGTFVNDTWQASRNLTVNMGLRYERNTPVQTYSGIASVTNEDQTAIIPGSAGFEFHDPNTKNFAPRVGVAYRLKDKTILRAGWGIYYNPVHMNLFTLLTTNPPQASRFTLDSAPSNPTLSLENPSGQAGPGGAPDVTTIDRDLPDHRKDQWSVDIQQELWPGTALELSYLRARTSHIDRSFLLNTPQPGPGPVNARRPNPLYNVIRYQTNDLIAEYDAVTVHLRRRMGHGLQADAHYTWSRSYDMANNSGAGATTDPFDIRADYGPTNNDVPHRLVASYIYELPFFRDSGSLLSRHLLGGWQVGGITIVESGRPFSVTIQGDRANTGIGGQRADLVGGVPDLTCEENPSGPGLINCIDPSAFAQPGEFTYGNAPRNLMRGPYVFTTDVSLIKQIRFGDRAQLQLRLETFNLFNRVNFNSPSGAFGTANFGRITSAGDMRRFELGAKLVF